MLVKISQNDSSWVKLSQPNNHLNSSLPDSNNKIFDINAYNIIIVI